MKAKPIRAVAFRVPNNKKGQRFLKDARAYVNRERYSGVSARPRGGTRTHWDYEREGCKWFGVYLIESKRQRKEDRKVKERMYVSKFDHVRLVSEHREIADSRLEDIHDMQGWLDKSAAEARTLRRMVKILKVCLFIAFIAGAVVGYFT